MSDDTRWTPRVVSGRDASTALSGTAQFRTLWDALAEILGTAATAVLMRRAARRAMARHRELGELAIERVDGEFHYTVPGSFHASEGPPVVLRELAVELWPLLAEMTGEVALRHLEQRPELRQLVAAAPS